MEKLRILTLTLLWLVVSTSGNIIPKNHEVTYKYETLINTTIVGSATRCAAIVIRSNLLVLGLESAIQVTFRNVTYHQILDYETEDTVVQLDPSEKIHLPFLVQYDSKGKTMGILASKEDVLRSLNIKKAIAALFQLDLSQIDFKNSSSYGFISDELCLYGVCETSYSVHNKIGKTRITKHFKPSPSNIEKYNPLFVTVDRIYHLEQQEGEISLDQIETQSIISLDMDISKKEVHTIFLNQKLEKINTNIFNGNTVETQRSEMEPHKIELNWINRSGQAENEFDFTGSKSSRDKKSLSDFVERLEKFYVYTKENDIILSSTYFKREDTVHFLLDEMRTFDEENLKECFEIIQESGPRQIFIRLIPFLGTRASAFFIADIVSTSKINEKDSIGMLREFPFHLRKTNLEIIKIYTSLTEEDNMKSDAVRNVIKLSVASLVTNFIKLNPKDKTVERIIDKHIEAFKNETNYGQSIFRMSVLHNIKSDKVTNLYEQIISKELNLAPRFRVLAMFGAKSEHSKDQKALDKYYWPVLEDKNEPLEARMTALNVLMAMPTVENLLKMYNFMQNETNEEIYSSYYTLLKSLAHSTQKNSGSAARKIVLMPHRPKSMSAKSIDYIFDHFDTKNGFGLSLTASAISTDYASYYFQLSPKSSLVRRNRYAIRYRLGIEPGTPGIPSIINWKLPVTWKEFGTQIYFPKFYSKMMAEMVLMKNGRVVYSDFSTMETMNYNMSHDFAFDSFAFDIHESDEIYIPTDIGSPAFYYGTQIEIAFLKNNVSREDTKRKMNRLGHGIYGLKIYNPFVDTWQGTRKNNVANLNVPISIKYLEDKMAILNEDGKAIGFRSYPYSELFIEKSSGTANCSGCEKSTTVPITGRNLNTISWSVADEYTGGTYNFGIFECESQKDKTLSDAVDVLTNDQTWIDFPTLKMLISSIRLWTYFTSSTANRCGVGFSARPDFKNITFSNTGFIDKDPTGNTVSLNMNSNLSWPNGNLTAWTLSFTMHINDLNSTDLRVRLTKERKVFCLNGGDAIRGERIDFHYDFDYGESVDGECPTEGASIGIVGSAKRSEEQTRKDIDREFFERCLENESFSLKCAMSLNSLREFSVRGRLKNVSENLKSLLRSAGDRLKSRPVSDGVPIPEDEFRSTVTFPLMSDTFSWKLSTHSETFRVENARRDGWLLSMWLAPQNLYYGNQFRFRYESWKTFENYLSNEFPFCEVKADSYTNMRFTQVQKNLTEEWTLFGRDKDLTNVTGQWRLELRKIADKQMALRITSDGEVLDIALNGGVDVQLNDTPLYNNGEASRFKLKLIPEPKRVLLSIDKLLMTIDFDGETFLMQSPHYKEYGKGLCYSYIDFFGLSHDE